MRQLQLVARRAARAAAHAAEVVRHEKIDGRLLRGSAELVEVLQWVAVPSTDV